MKSSYRIAIYSVLFCLVSCMVFCQRRVPMVSTDTPSTAPSKLSSGMQLNVIAEKLSQPVGLVYAPISGDKRLFVVEKTGRVRILRDKTVEKTPFLDLSSRLSFGSEQGLLGLAFHPKYAENGRLYVNYTDKDGDTNVVEFQVSTTSPDVVDIKTEREVLRIEQPYSNHNGGNLVFGPDGLLYIGTGDGGSANDPKGNGQNTKSLLGKMLRVDPTLEKPKPEIYLVGLRNPWRYGFDRKTGDLWIGDVGQNLYEEVHMIPAKSKAGLNLGWNIVEGNQHCLQGKHCKTDGLVAPVFEYSHNVGCSITGGFVYRGKALPDLVGHYVYTDYCSGLFRSFRWDGTSIVDHWDWKQALDPDSTLASLSAFGEDQEGELYLLSLDGVIYKLQPR